MTVLADVNEVRPGDGIVVVEFNGEHDSSTKAERAELLSRLIDGNVHVVVDVSQSQFIDSTFIHNVLVANRLASERGKTFRLQVGTTPIVRRALEVSGILDSVSIAYNREGALA